jgi:archaellum biogenesis ATPase FlaH
MIVTKMPTEKEVNDALKYHQIFLWETRFDFLKCTQGIRQSSLIGLLGTTGSGKSSLFKSIIADSCDNKCLVWLTEETRENYSGGIKASKHDTLYDNIRFFHEDDIGEEIRNNLDDLIKYIIDLIVGSGVRIVFLDNITTSCLYSSHFGEKGQAKVITTLKNFAHNNKITIFFMAHTQKNINNDSVNKLISGEDIRGTNQAFMAADYFYILQRFESDEIFTFIRVVKHRYHTDLSKKSYQLEYDRAGFYKKDCFISFETINEHFQKRNFLGKRKNGKDKQI